MDKYEHRRLRLLELRDARCEKKGAVLARKIGREPSYVTRMLYPEGKAGKKRIADDMIEVIENAFGLSRGWFDMPLGSQLLHSPEHVSPLAYTEKHVTHVQSFADNNTKPAHGRLGRVPLISWVQAGAFAEAVDMFAVGDAEAWVTTTKPVRAHTFALRVVGDSMVSDDAKEKSFPEGMILIVEPDADPLPGMFVIAKNGGEATFKQLIKDGPDWYLRPLNKRYPMKPLGNAEIIGVVVQATWDLT